MIENRPGEDVQMLAQLLRVAEEEYEETDQQRIGAAAWIATLPPGDERRHLTSRLHAAQARFDAKVEAFEQQN